MAQEIDDKSHLTTILLCSKSRAIQKLNACMCKGYIYKT